MVKEQPGEKCSLSLSVSLLAAWCRVLGWNPSCGYSLITCKLKVPLAAATAPWLLIPIQSLSLQEAQERPLDSGDWIKPEEYDPDAKQVNAKEWAGLFVTEERASGFCICEWGCEYCPRLPRCGMEMPTISSLYPLLLSALCRRSLNARL